MILICAPILTVVAVVGRRVGVRDDEVAKIHRIPSAPHRDPLQILHLYTHLTVEDIQSYHTHLDVVGQAEGDLHVGGRAQHGSLLVPVPEAGRPPTHRPGQDGGGGLVLDIAGPRALRANPEKCVRACGANKIFSKYLTVV